MKKWQKALAHVIKHPKESWNFVTKRDKESFGVLDFTYENGEWTGSLGMIGGIGLPSGPSDTAEIISYIEAFTIAFVIIGILTLIVMIWFVTVVYRLGSQAKPACEHNLMGNWKFIGKHLAIALILSMFLPGLGHLYLIYVLIRAETTFSEVRTQSVRSKANNLSQDPKPTGARTIEIPDESREDAGRNVDYNVSAGADTPIGKVVGDTNAEVHGKAQLDLTGPLRYNKQEVKSVRDHLKHPAT